MIRNAAGGGSIFMNARLVAVFTKNKLEEIRVSLLKNNKIDLRGYFYFQNEGTPRPTKKGVWLSFKHLPPIIEAFTRFKKDPDAPFLVRFDVTAREKIHVYPSQYRGATVLHIRTFYLKDNEFLPGKGVSFAASLLPPVLDILQKLNREKDAIKPFIPSARPAEAAVDAPAPGQHEAGQEIPAPVPAAVRKRKKAANAKNVA